MADPISALDAASGTRLLKYPSDYEAKSGNWVNFTRIKYKKNSIFGASTTEPTGSVISLPMPPSLSTSYGADWENSAMGITGAVVGKGLGSAAEGILKSLKSGSSGFQSLVDGIKSGNNYGKLGEQYVVAAAIDAATSTNVAGQALMAVGIARNPHKSLSFNAPRFRTFNFQYKLTPKSREETRTVNSIIQEFKQASLPSFTEATENNLFNYPDMYQISFTHDSYLFKIGNCIISDVSVDYHGEGTPAYLGIDGTKAPASILLNLTFNEAEIMTREKSLDGF